MSVTCCHQDGMRTVVAMKVVIAGGHGKIALRLSRLIAERHERPSGLIRTPEHEADLIAVGAHPVIFDL